MRTIFPKEAFAHFKNYFKYMRVPFAVYADFESFTEKLDSVRDLDVRLPLRLRQEKLWTEIQTIIHRHRQHVLYDPNGRFL